MIATKVVVVFLAAVAAADAVCCGVPLGGQQQCNDGTVQWGCCGNGACNIFCCNCDRGCREPHNAEECKKGCDGWNGNCYSACYTGGTVSPFGTAQCIRKCDRETRDCKSNCDASYPPTAKVEVAKADPAVFAYHAHNGVDTDNNGGIDLNEFKDFIKAQSGEVPGDTVLKAMFFNVDHDQDGSITRQEFDEDAAK